MKKSKLIGKITHKSKIGLVNGGRPRLYSPREKLYDCIWVFTIGDADDHPSIPHAHAQEKGFRLDAWTGDIYPAGNERERIIGKLKRKELEKLHSDPQFLAFARKQIDWYREENPHISFYVPEWFELKYKQPQLLAKNVESELEVFVFCGKASVKQS